MFSEAVVTHAKNYTDYRFQDGHLVRQATGEIVPVDDEKSVFRLLDLEYIDSWSPMLDVKILLKTIPVVLSGRGAS